jgi:hypothetical protein
MAMLGLTAPRRIWARLNMCHRLHRARSIDRVGRAGRPPSSSTTRRRGSARFAGGSTNVRIPFSPVAIHGVAQNGSILPPLEMQFQSVDCLRHAPGATAQGGLALADRQIDSLDKGSVNLFRIGFPAACRASAFRKAVDATPLPVR